MVRTQSIYSNFHTHDRVEVLEDGTWHQGRVLITNDRGEPGVMLDANLNGYRMRFPDLGQVRHLERREVA